MKRIGLFGGTFDPIHNAHIAMGHMCADTLGLDKVIYIPTGVMHHKESPVQSPHVRFEMVKLAVSGADGFEASDYETNKLTPSYSTETVGHFKKLYPDSELVFILGEDSLNYIEQWHDAERLLRMCSFAVIGRGGSAEKIGAEAARLKEKYGTRIYYVYSQVMDISSHEIRRMAANGEKIEEFVPEAVCEYIARNGLYKAEE